MAQTIIDGGGKTYTSSITLKSNTTYQNYVISGAGQFTSNSLSVTNVKILNCTFTNTTSIPIMIASWGFAPASSNIEVAGCTMNNFNGNQYYWWFQNCSGLNIHDNLFTNGTGEADAGVIFPQQSSGNFYRMFFNNYYGKAIRFWPAGSTTSAIYNIIAVNSTAYSGIELQEVSGQTGWNVSVDNCTLGNFAGTIPTAAITLYLPSSPVMAYSFGATKGNIVFNDTLGTLLDNGGATTGPAAPINTNWQTANKYYPTMQAAGFANVAALTLPDGTAWNSGSTVTPVPPANKPPVANAGANQTVTLPINFAILNGTASADSDGSIASYAWTQTSGPNTATLIGANTAIASASGLVTGTYIFSLLVTDNQGATNSAVTSVIVNPAVIPPKTIVEVDITYKYSDGTTLNTVQN